MATIVIDGVEERQQEGLTFRDFIISYPGCFLKREDGVSIRVPDTLLETGKKYTLIRPSLQPVPATVNLGELVVRGGLRKDLLQVKVLERMIDRFSAKANIALYSQDAKLAREIYDDAIQLPLTATCQELSTDYDIIVDGCLYRDNTHLQICFLDGIPSVLKSVRRNEYNRAKALESKNVKHAHLVELRPVSLERKIFVVMPLLPITVTSLSGIPERQANKLWDQVASGLECLHGHGFAHKDVKPDNICIDSQGNFILIDMGDTVEFGELSNSTPQFVPRDFNGDAPATAALDWAMLTVTVYDRMQPQGEGVGAKEPELSIDDLLAWFNRKGFTTLATKMQKKKDASGVDANEKG